jgi:outer membrane protein OmpA-like peptidoglycan-associated protein
LHINLTFLKLKQSQMSTFNLLDMAKSYLTNELVSKASGALGESEGGISKILSAAVPSLISSIADKASTTDGAHAVAKMAAEQHNSGILGSLGNFFGGGDSSNSMLGAGGGIISSLLGSKGNMLTSLISNFAGAKSGTVGTILSMAAPAILGMIGKHSADNNVSASGLGSLMAGQKDLAMKALPGGFNLSSIFSGDTSSVTNTASNAYHEVEEKASSGMKWLLPVIILGAIAAGALYMFKDGCKGANSPTAVIEKGAEKVGDVANNAVAAVKATVDSVTGLVNYDLGAMADLELPGGAKINCAANGFENTLVNFIKTGTIDTVNKGANWFNLHDVQFVSGKTAYSTPKAMAQIKNVAAVLKAYPNVVIKLGGNTDISGDAAANKALSQSRANQVMKDLIASGAAATQIKEATGYGSEFATAKVGDKAGMAQDRKTTAKVASK